MNFNFDNIKKEPFENFKGGLGTIYIQKYVDGENTIMRITLPENASVGHHLHEETTEFIYVLEGELMGNTDANIPEFLSKGDVHVCKKGHQHTLLNSGKGDAVILAIVAKQ